VNALAKEQPVIVFDNKGLGKSSGTTPDSIAQMAADAASFISALGFSIVDLLGYSLGGMIAQILAAEHSNLVRIGDVLQDEVTQTESLSGRPMFGDRFPA
jgi:pimeloyl-ACP methyl ester carboxylesterase